MSTTYAPAHYPVLRESWLVCGETWQHLATNSHKGRIHHAKTGNTGYRRNGSDIRPRQHGKGGDRVFLDGDLVAYFSFDASNGGLDATDDSGNGNDGTVTNAIADCADTPPTVMNTCSADFDGDGDIVEAANEAAFDLTDFSLAFWFNLQGTSSDNVAPRPISKGQSTGSDGSYGVFIIDNGADSIGQRVRDGGTTLDVSDPTPGYAIGEWHHVVSTFDEATCTRNLYFDGVLEATSSTGTAPCTPNNVGNPFSIGGVSGGAQERDFNGKIDEVRVYNVVLSAANVALLASGGVESDPYADAVAFDGINEASCDGNCRNAAEDAVGPPDNVGAGLGDDGFLDLAFTNNTCLVNGTDLDVSEEADNEGNFVGFGATGNAAFSIGSVGPFIGDEIDIDLSSTGVGVFNEIKIVDDGVPADPSNSAFNGADIDAVECLNNLAFGPDHIEKRNTGLTDIDVGFGILQDGFQFTITIWNNTGADDGLAGLIFRDVVPGEFDLDGVPVDNNDCIVTTDNPEGAKKKSLSKLEPEFIDIDAGLLMNGESCTITVDVKTDAKTFPNGRSPAFAPTSCDTTIVLNEGVQVFLDDGDDPDEVDKNDTPLFLDDDSIELTCLFL